MAGGGLLRCCATLAMFMVVELLLQASVQRVKIVNHLHQLLLRRTPMLSFFLVGIQV